METSQIFDALNIPGWSRVYFIFDEATNYLVHADHTDSYQTSKSLRREQWIVSGNAHIYQCRETPTSDWGPVFYSDCGPDVEVDPDDLNALSDLVYKQYGDSSSDEIHPCLIRY
jgi:hypothetical protein